MMIFFKEITHKEREKFIQITENIINYLVNEKRLTPLECYYVSKVLFESCEDELKKLANQEEKT